MYGSQEKGGPIYIKICVLFRLTVREIALFFGAFDLNNLKEKRLFRSTIL